MADTPRRSLDTDRHIREARDSAAYPRGIPYQPPAAAPPGNRSFVLGAVCALLLVGVTAGGTALVLNLTASRSQPPPAADNQKEAPPAADTGKKTAPAATERAPAAVDRKEKFIPRNAQERFLQALGSLSAAHVYQGYLNIGLLADGVESEAYTKAEGEQMLTTVAGLIEMADRQLDKIADMDLPADDKEGMKRIQKLTVLLRRQASALRAYWATGEQMQIARYQEAREAAWKDLSDLLGLE